jgi:hypothetical protein
MKLAQKSDLLKFFEVRRVPHAVAVTLTLKQKIQIDDIRGRFELSLDPIRVSENTRHFMNRLNQRVFGKGYLRYGNRLSVIPVIEGNSFTRLHVHMTIEKPNYLNLRQFEILATECWLKTKFGYSNIQIKPIHDYKGWIHYKMKNKSKGEGLQSSVDWDNVYLH